VNQLAALAQSDVTISGGSVPRIEAFAESVVNIVGTRFLLQGQDISATLPWYTPFELVDRNKQLAAFLPDGKVLSSALATSSHSTGTINIDATLNLIRALPGDFNLDQVVDAADYVTWRKNGGTSAAFNTWRANFGSNTGTSAAASATVPEPALPSLLWLGCCVACCVWRCR
jgi:hypothetical protein